MAKHSKIKCKYNIKKINKKTAEIFGLPNLGNTCYANAILQVIYKANKMMNRDEITDYNSNDIFDKFFSLRKISNKIEKFNILKGILTEVDKKYASLNDKYDAVVFYRDLLNQNMKSKKFKNLKENFEGLVENLFYCNKCENSEKLLESFIDINLSSECNSLAEMQLLFNKYWHDENIDDFWCQTCNEPNKITYSKRITKIPKFLTIVCNINNIQEDKNHILHINYNNDSYNYKLFALVNYNNLKEHYTAEVKINHDKWILFDDNKIRKNYITNSENKIMMLFYKLF